MWFIFFFYLARNFNNDIVGEELGKIVIDADAAHNDQHRLLDSQRFVELKKKSMCSIPVASLDEFSIVKRPLIQSPLSPPSRKFQLDSTNERKDCEERVWLGPS